MRDSTAVAAALALVAGLFGACELPVEEGSDAEPAPQEDTAEPFPEPTMEVKDAELVLSPTAKNLLSYYCPQVLGTSSPIPGTTPCSAIGLGKAPAKASLTFYFDVRMEATNNGDEPVKATDMLTNLNVFPGGGDSAVGVACVRFCDEGDAGCDGAPDAESCQVEGEGAWDDVEGAVDGIIHAASPGEAGVGGDDNLSVKVLPPGETVELNVVFGLDNGVILGVLKKAATSPLQTGALNAEFFIPYALEGSLFFSLPDGERTGLDFGPAEAKWEIL